MKLLKCAWRIISYNNIKIVISIQNFIFISLLFLATLNSKASESSDLNSSLHFVATTEQVKLLSQKLEYHIQDKNTILIGNLIISNQNLRLYLENNLVYLESPLQFTVGGALLIKDPLGKALWRHRIDSPEQVNKFNHVTSEKKHLRGESGVFKLGSIDDLKKIIEDSSFFNFCTFIESKSTRIQACSENYILSQKNEQWTLETTKSKENNSTILINGSEVNEHGIIQFDNEIKSISLAATLESGLQIEIKTQVVELELMDLFYSKEDAKINLKLREKSNEKISIPWSSQISLNEPYLYIEAFGQVPMRQELYINNVYLPLSEDKPKVLSASKKSYSSSTTLFLESSSKLKIRPKTKGDRISRGKSITKWYINNLEPNESNQHELEILSRDKKFILAMGFQRRSSWVINMELGYGKGLLSYKKSNLDSSEDYPVNIIQISFQKYFNTLLNSTSSLNHLRWGLHGSVSQVQGEKIKYKVNQNELSLSYRFNENFHHTESSFSIHLGYLSNQSQFQDTTLEVNPLTSSNSTNPMNQWLGFKIQHDGPQNFLSFLLGSQHDFEIAYFPTCLSQYCKSISISKLLWQSRYRINTSTFWNWSLNINQLYNKSPEFESTIYHSFFQLGLGYEF